VRADYLLLLMRDSFGARLRLHREQKHVSLGEVAEQTKIKASLLEGLERDDISQWPAGIFRRAYVRAYAAAIGFDPDTAVREFLAVYTNPAETAEPPPPAPSGLRGLFESFRRRPSIAIPASVSESASAAAGKRIVEDPPTTAVKEAPAEPVEPTVTAQAEAPMVPSSESPAARPGPRAVDAPVRAPDAGLKAADLLAAARVCTELGRVEDAGQIVPLLGEAAKVLRARGLIVWVWDSAGEELKPALVHGYSGKVRARLRGVSASADNLTAAAYRAAAPLGRSGALAVPLLAASGCAGVLAIEVDNGREQETDVRALATFFAAMLTQFVASPAAEAREVDPPEAPGTPVPAVSAVQPR
jgi:transcriptional regulator with XRE-family HTH domain